MGMEVLAYDPFVSAERAQQMQVRLSPLKELFAEVDYVSLHLPRTPETENLVNAELLRTMKPTARLVNCARGGIVDEAALAEAVTAGTIAGAALDVFAKEPLAADSPLRGVSERLILTPHLGASTEEAQENVAIDVAEQIRDVLLGLPARSAVNIPGLSSEVMEQLKPHLQLAETLGQLVSQLSGGAINELEVRLQGDFAVHPAQPLVVAALKGVLSTALGDSINYVNASLEAKERGIKVLEVKDDASRDFAGGSLQLIARGGRGTHSVTGAVFADGELRPGRPAGIAPGRCHHPLGDAPRMTERRAKLRVIVAEPVVEEVDLAHQQLERGIVATGEDCAADSAHRTGHNRGAHRQANAALRLPAE
jgi:D-3-phosphoglycerate dehydrogenase